MSIYYPEEKPYKDHRGAPPMSVYLMSDDASEMRQLNCMWCRRTIADIKGQIDTIIGTPMPLQEFDIAVNIRCKLCHQDYRLLVKSEISQR